MAEISVKEVEEAFSKYMKMDFGKLAEVVSEHVAQARQGKKPVNAETKGLMKAFNLKKEEHYAIKAPNYRIGGLDIRKMVAPSAEFEIVKNKAGKDVCLERDKLRNFIKKFVRDKIREAEEKRVKNGGKFLKFDVPADEEAIKRKAERENAVANKKKEKFLKSRIAKALSPKALEVELTARGF